MTQLELFPLTEMENLDHLQKQKDNNDLSNLLNATDSFEQLCSLSQPRSKWLMFDTLKKRYQCPEPKI